MIVHIKGIPGSGKTWICSAISSLSNVVCIDLDDLVSVVYRKLKESPRFVKALERKPPAQGPSAAMKTMRKACCKFAAAVAKKHEAAGKIVVFVGITIEVKSDIGFFIKMTDDELTIAYGRVMLRELDKVTRNAQWIRGKIAAGDVKTLGYDVNLEHHIGALELTTLLSTYRGMYTGAARFEKKNGLLLKPQQEIIKAITKLSSDQKDSRRNE